jgi:rhodanese-related sulfurtransferase
VDPRTLHQRRAEFQIIDVREDDEWAAGGIAGARHIPLGQLSVRLDELDRDRPIVMVCRTGNCSALATSY